MDASLKQEWVQALRSGQYIQGKGSLCRVFQDGIEYYCCLGVLYDQLPGAFWDRYMVFDDHEEEWGVPTNPRQSPPPEDKSLAPDDVNSGILPPWVLERVGLSDSSQANLVQYNDNGETFSFIADWIEANL